MMLSGPRQIDSLLPMENRPEPRVATNLVIRVLGMSADGKPFLQNAEAHNISSQGAKISGIEHQLTPGDVIGLQLGDKKARYRVVWTIDAGHLLKIQAGVQLVDGQQCPWIKELTQAEEKPAPATSTSPTSSSPTSGPSKDNRRFQRLKIRFPLELREDRGPGSRMQTGTADISGRGCYVETMLPLARGTELNISLWIESEKVDTTGVVRACDGGVGMGIEFTGMDLGSQERLQRFLEKLERESKSSAAPPAGS
jgi:hypothetical protein